MKVLEPPRGPPEMTSLNSVIGAAREDADRLGADYKIEARLGRGAGGGEVVHWL